jgi:hypothetical protein
VGSCPTSIGTTPTDPQQLLGKQEPPLGRRRVGEHHRDLGLRVLTAIAAAISATRLPAPTSPWSKRIIDAGAPCRGGSRGTRAPLPVLERDPVLELELAQRAVDRVLVPAPARACPAADSSCRR